VAGSSRYTAVLDANVLYPNLLRDLLISLAVAGLYSARWTEQINDEWARNLKTNRPELAEKVDSLRETVNKAVPDCLIENFEAYIPTINLPDPSDRHVLAAAIAGHADAIVTVNLKDFPSEVLALYEIEALHPDDFIMNQLELPPREALLTVKEVRARMKSPPIIAADFLSMIERSGLLQTAWHLFERNQMSKLSAPSTPYVGFSSKSSGCN
jgi:predicted nucleic acid-binding protein